MEHGTWSAASFQNAGIPRRTTTQCYAALADLFQNRSTTLAVATEASSHPSGVSSLTAQPWLYGGGSLGNTLECPDDMHVCLAGHSPVGPVHFASVCTVTECTAADLAAPDFLQRLDLASDFGTEQTSRLRESYKDVFQRIHEVNAYLKTGWTCGTYQPRWKHIPSAVYLTILCASVVLCILARLQQSRHRVRCDHSFIKVSVNGQAQSQPQSSHLQPQSQPQPPCRPHNHTNGHNICRSRRSWHFDSFLAVWSVSANTRLLSKHRSETAFLDGLKVWSILWIIVGHCMALQSDSGGGYLNPKDFLPPNGITSKFLGQLIFSSRFAVDTFLCISGFLVVYTVRNKFQSTPNAKSVLCLLIMRIMRILPLYAACLGFWVLIAPHCSMGPFSYQWQKFIAPCEQYWWTNLLFINNFIPWDHPTADTCFFHSWYLAVDVQLFFILVPTFVCIWFTSRTAARRTTLALFVASVLTTASLTHARHWSINTFDGAAIIRFDTEGYSKPHIRAQAYLAGMYTAMFDWKLQPRQIRNLVAMVVAIAGMAILSVITVTGAYARRACQYYEWPSQHQCGSTWSDSATFVYSAFSRAIWSICIAVMLKLCVDGQGRVVGELLSWRIWTPLAQLSFGVYLVHPIVILIWRLGGDAKEVFRPFTFFMDCISVTVTSFGIAYLAAIIVELPCRGILLRMQKQTIARELPAAEAQRLVTRRLNSDTPAIATRDSYQSISTETSDV